MDKNLFLHVCCGPCAIWPIQDLIQADFKLTGFFYNPNIHPEIERKRRQENCQKVFTQWDLPLVVDSENLQSSWEKETWSPEFSNKCEMCYKLRLFKTAEIGAKQGFLFFSTSLLVSPYQNQELLIHYGREAEKHYNIHFVARDFRSGFRKGQDTAKEYHLYRQKYCGCICSLNESDFKAKILAEHQILEAKGG